MFDPPGGAWLLPLFIAIILCLWLGSALSISRLLRGEPDARRVLWGLAAWSLALTAWRAPTPAHFYTPVSATFPTNISKIGLGWPSLVAALSHVLPRTDWISFGAARLCGVLTGPVAYAALRRLSVDRRAAVLGAALLVALPFQIALATGDDAHPAALLLFLAGLSHFADYARSERRGDFALAAPCLILMVHTRLETAFLLLSILVLVARPRAFAALLRRDAHLHIAAGVATAVFTRMAIAPDLQRCLPYPSGAALLREAVNAVTLFPAMGERFTVDETVRGVVSNLDGVTFDKITWVPVVLLPLLWLGWGKVLTSEMGWRMLAAVLLARLPGYAYLGVDGTDYLGSRHFVGVLPLLCLVTAVGVVTIRDKLGLTSLPIMLFAAHLFVVESLTPLRYRFAFQEEYASLRQAITALPRGADVSDLQFEFGLAPAQSSLRLLRPDLQWVDFGRDDASDTRFAYVGPDCQALMDTNFEQAIDGYINRADRLALLRHLADRCRLFTSRPRGRVLWRGSVSRRGHGPPIDLGPRLPIVLVELASTRGTDAAAR